MKQIYNMIKKESLNYTYIFTFDDLCISIHIKDKKVTNYIQSYIISENEGTNFTKDIDYEVFLVNNLNIYQDLHKKIKCYSKLTFIEKMNSKRIYIFTIGDEIKSATEIIRVFREIIIRHSENCGKIMMYSAAVMRKTVFLICDDKGRGKTTIMAYLLKNGYHYIANDRVILSKQMQLSYFPLAIRVGVGTMRADNNLYEKVKISQLQRTQHITSVLSALVLIKLFFHKISCHVILKKNGGGNYGKTKDIYY